MALGRRVKPQYRARTALTVLMVVVLSGCFSRQVDPGYPSDWSPPEQKMVGSCPSIGGVYRNLGELGASGVECGGTARYGLGRDHGEWNCSPRLLRNLGIVGQAETVEIEQADENSLKIKYRDINGGLQGTEVLRRGWIYSCDNGILAFSETAPLGGWAMMPIWILSLHGGGSSHTRSFVRDRNGALVMTVRENNAAFSVFFFVSASGTGYIRWLPVNVVQPGSSEVPGE